MKASLTMNRRPAGYDVFDAENNHVCLVSKHRDETTTQLKERALDLLYIIERGLEVIQSEQ